MVNKMKKGFLGLTAHWIAVEEKVWELQVAVIRFKSISGGHDGLNLGRYMVGLTDHIGITGQDFSKVRFPRTVIYFDY